MEKNNDVIEKGNDVMEKENDEMVEKNDEIGKYYIILNILGLLQM